MTKISALAQDTSPSLTDYLATVDIETLQSKRVVISDLITLIQASIIPTGLITEYGGNVAPTGYLLCYGQAVSRSTYAALFAVLVTLIGTPTISNASPGVVTLNGHGLLNGNKVYLTSTGALPTGLSQNTLYYVVSATTNTFSLSATLGGAAINTSSAGSGTHSLFRCPYGLGDGSTTFNVPDFRGRNPAGADNMGGTAAARLTSATMYGVEGSAGGAETHTLTLAQAPAHQHNASTRAGASGFGSNELGRANATGSLDSIALMDSQGGGGAHNNVQPTLVTNFIIKT